MCGIAGLVHQRDRPVPPAWLQSLGRSLDHRGPDDSGELLLSLAGILSRHPSDQPIQAALIHRRLSIIDVSSRASQPMSSPDDRFHLVFNGMIYNYRELRPELESLGWRFRSSSDTEVLLAAWALWGTACLTRFIGMFAFVMLDTRERTLWLARDFFGIKPLYYALSKDGLAFASEATALLQIPTVSRTPDAHRIFQYLRFGLTDDGERTFFADIHQLPAASWLRISLADPTHIFIEKYWHPAAPRQTDISFDESTTELRRLFLHSLSLHTRSDVPLGVTLSGGIDSSAILAGTRQVFGAAAELHSVSYIADDPAICEESWVDLAAQTSGTTVHKLRLSPADLVADLDELIRIQGEPFGGTSIYAQFAVFRLAHQAGLKVMLDGQGADELFGGYDAYRAARLTSLIKQGHWGQAIRFLRRLRTTSGNSTTRRLAAVLGHLLPDSWQTMPRRFAGKSVLPRWLRENWFAQRGVIPSPLFHHASKEVLREQLLQALTQTSLPMLLRFEDRNSMAFSIESRVPFLTPALAHFANSLPEDYHIGPDAQGKRILRAALGGLVPQPILDRRDKIGFSTPEKQWLHHLAAAFNLETDQALASLPMIHFDIIQNEWNAIGHGGRPSPYHWRLLNLSRWANRFQVILSA